MRWLETRLSFVLVDGIHPAKKGEMVMDVLEKVLEQSRCRQWLPLR